MIYKGRYVALVEYDFSFDSANPGARAIEDIKEMFASGSVEKGMAEILRDYVFDESLGKSKVTQTFFDMYAAPEDRVKEDTYAAD